MTVTIVEEHTTTTHTEVAEFALSQGGLSITFEDGGMVSEAFLEPPIEVKVEA